MKTTYKNILSALFFPATIFYYEMIFRESTVHGIWGISFYPTLLFSLLYGGFLFLILSLIKNKRIYFTTNLSLLCLTAIPFLVEFFVYRQFKIFYDLNTVAGGAGDVAGGFMDDVLRLIFSFDGLYHIFLFLLPAVLYGIFGRKQVFIPDFSEKLRHGTIFTLAALFIVTLFTVNFHKPFSNAYDHQYSFQSAVSNFGLITGIRLDATRNISGDDGGFEAMDMAALEETVVESEIEKESVETEPEYGDSIMNIDFKALAEQSSGVYAEMDNYVASLQPSSKNKYTGIFEGKNLIFITAEAFSEELIDPE